MTRDPRSKSEPELTQLWAWHQPLNLGPGSKQVTPNSSVTQHNEQGAHILLSCYYREFTHSLIPHDLVDRAARITHIMLYI